MVSVVTNPVAAWRRILVDASRIASWARRAGTDEQKVATQQLLETLNTFAPHFDLTLMSPGFIASIDKPIVPVKEHEPSPHGWGFIAYMRGIPYKECRYEDGTPEADEWREGWRKAQNDQSE